MLCIEGAVSYYWFSIIPSIKFPHSESVPWICYSSLSRRPNPVRTYFVEMHVVDIGRILVTCQRSCIFRVCSCELHCIFFDHKDSHFPFFGVWFNCFVKIWIASNKQVIRIGCGIVPDDTWATKPIFLSFKLCHWCRFGIYFGQKKFRCVIKIIRQVN